MPLFRNPFVWLSRIRHRRGYGVHSPFAFGFITGVVYERQPYYAYGDLAACHPWWMRWLGLGPVRRCRLLLRLANFSEAGTVRVAGGTAAERAYVRAARPRAVWVEDGAADFVLLSAGHLGKAAAVVGAMPPRGMLVAEGIHASKAARNEWEALRDDARVGVTFDLYDYGICFFDHSLSKQHYIVNF